MSAHDDERIGAMFDSWLDSYWPVTFGDAIVNAFRIGAATFAVREAIECVFDAEEFRDRIRAAGAPADLVAQARDHIGRNVALAEQAQAVLIEVYRRDLAQSVQRHIATTPERRARA